MNERTIWMVRFLGIAVFLLLAWLMLDLYARLSRMHQQAPPAPPPAASTTP